MATDAGYAKYVCDQLHAAGGIAARKMFGEYGLYRHGKIVGLIADNQLFVKPTPAGETVLGVPTYGPPYPGARPFFNVSDLLDDPDTLVRLIEATDAALPAPTQKPSKKAAMKTAVAKTTAAPKWTTKPPVAKRRVAKKAVAKKATTGKFVAKKKTASGRRAAKRPGR